MRPFLPSRDAMFLQIRPVMLGRLTFAVTGFIVKPCAY
ncbi:hypothetical protein CEV31_1333 [Brucella thiophenivorans]|uniref:Uncharacterized protein n=1 Tax=Brucella thiophenivorans TaxID=571255 RepID=A0A256FYJ3_9HYPH|nr:hypothetical protein CEV31_1333 [Brucella thiophenivorans]